MFESFVNSYNMSLLTLFIDLGFLGGILRICLVGAVLVLAICVTRNLINIFRGANNVDYKSLLIRTGVVVCIIALYPTIYLGVIKFNDRILLVASAQVADNKLVSGLSRQSNIITQDSINKYRNSKTAILGDDFTTKELEDEGSNIEGEIEQQEFSSYMGANLPQQPDEEKDTRSYLGGYIPQPQTAGNNQEYYNKYSGAYVPNRSIFNLSAEALITGVVTFLSKVLIYFFSIIRSILFSIYLLLGPFVVTLFIYEGTADFFKGFIMSFLNVLLWPWIQFIILIAIDLTIVTVRYQGINEFIGTCAAHLALIYMLLKSTSFIPDLRRGRAGSDSGMVINSVINTGLRAASLGAKSAIGTAFPQVAPFLGTEGVGNLIGEGIKKGMGAAKKGMRR